MRDPKLPFLPALLPLDASYHPSDWVRTMFFGFLTSIRFQCAFDRGNLEPSSPLADLVLQLLPLFFYLSIPFDLSLSRRRCDWPKWRSSNSSLCTSLFRFCQTSTILSLKTHRSKIPFKRRSLRKRSRFEI